MIGPNAEYLEAARAMSSGAKKLREKLKTALERFKKLRKKEKYAYRPVPKVANYAVPEVAGKDLVFRVFLRDLPRAKDDDSGRRFEKKDFRAHWSQFIEWAWNVNWIGFDNATDFVPRGTKPEEVKSRTFRRICREVLVDNVRGQTPAWKDEHVKLAALSMQRVKSSGGKWTIEYRGKASMDSESQKFAPTLYGRGVWIPKKKEFESLELVAIGDREGAGTFNQRTEDMGPAPIGVALVLHRSETADKE